MAQTTTYKARWTDNEGNVRLRSGRSPHPFKDAAELRAFLLKVNASYNDTLDVTITGHPDIAVVGQTDDGKSILDAEAMMARPSEFA